MTILELVGCLHSYFFVWWEKSVHVELYWAGVKTLILFCSLQIGAVRAVVPNKSNNEIVLVLQHFENCVDKAVQAFLEGMCTSVYNLENRHALDAAL